jgi:hypothetical protein
VDGTLTASPRLVQQVQDALRAVDASWGGGSGEDWLAGQLKFTLDRLTQERRTALVAPPRPARPASLALAARFGAVADPAVTRAAAAMVSNWRTGPPPKPEEREAKMAQSAQAFLAAAAKATPFAVEEAVFAQATDAAGHANLLLLLDRVFHEPRDQPTYVESRFLRRLAVAARLAPAAWPADLARTAVAAVLRTEEACARPDLWPWAGPLLEACAEARWEGELLLTHWGAVPPDEVARRFQDAGRRAEALLAFAAVLDAARAAADESLVALLPDAEYLDEEPARAMAWDARVRATAELLPLLDPPSRPAATFDDLLALTDGLRGPGESLRQQLAALRQDVSDGRTVLALVAAGRDDAGPAVARRIDALLRLPALPPDRRAALAQARTALAIRLAQRPADPAPPYTVAAADDARREEDRRAARRARCHLAVLRLGGVPADGLAKLEQLVARAEREGPDSRAWAELADGLRRAWADGLADAFALATPGGRDTLAALYPGDWPNPAIDTPAGGPRVAARSAAWGHHFAWLASRYRYVAKAGLDPTTMEDAAADADAGVGAPAQYPAVTVRPPALPVALPPDRPSAEVIVTVVQTGPSVGPLAVRALVPGDAVRVTVEEGSLRLADSPADGGRSAQVRLRVERGAAATALPAGFVVEARVGSRTGFVRVPLAAGSPAAALELVIDRSPTDPGGLGNDLRLRPAAAGQPFYAFVRNRTSQPRQAVVRVTGPLGLVPGGEAKVTVNAGETKLVPFVLAAGPATGGPPAFDLPGSVRLDVEDAAKPGEVIQSRSVRFDVADPAEYLELTGAAFEPNDSPARPVNRLRVTLRARRDLGSVPCFAELVLDRRFVPGLRGVKAGRLRGQVPPTGDPLVLDAEGLDLDPEAADVGTAFVTVDGVERAFGLRVDFARHGDPTAPVLDTQPRLTLALRPAPRPGRSVAFVVGADHAPSVSRLDVRLLRTDPDDPRPEQSVSLPTPRHQRGTVVVGPGGALVVTAAVADWELNWDLARLVGRRTLEARLTAGARVLQTVDLPLILDDTPPVVAFRNPPRQAKRGGPLLLRVDADDPESGVTGLQVYVGKPAADGNPPAGAVSVSATQSRDGAWEVRLPLPADKRGPTDVSARAINGAGLATWATAAVDLVDTLPTPPGAVAGRVLEGDRPQAGLEVQLLDEKGTVLKRTTTDADGTYRFDAVTPGRYRLASAKSSSRRTAKGNVTVAAGQTATVDLPLYL